MSEETSNPATEAGTTQEPASAVVTDGGSDTGTEIKYADGRFSSVTELEAGLTTAEKRYDDYRSMNDKRFGAFTGAPEGDYELKEGVTVPDGVIEFARENQFSNDALNGLVDTYNASQQAEQEAYVNEQKEMLGKDADTRLKNIQDWGKANGADTEVFESMITSAKAVEFLEGVMKSSQGTRPAQVPQSPAVDRDTLETMQRATDDNGNRRMSVDPAYREKVRAMRRQLQG